MSSLNYPHLPVLLVDDDKQVLLGFKILLNLNGINNIICCNDSRRVLSILSEKKVSIILLDLLMPHISGEEILTMIYQRFPEIPVIIITGINNEETRVKCMKNGAFDYIVKPVEEDNLLSGVKRAIEVYELNI